MVDIFDVEQKILDDALSREKHSAINFDEYKFLAEEYGKLLRQVRMYTKISDKTTFNLFENNLELNEKVHMDALTGIYNRRYLDDNLERIVRAMKRSGVGQLSVLMVDIDYFKKYNDTYGHNKGDECLKKVASAIAASISRPYDFAARYGGEEFVVVLPNTDSKGAIFIAERIFENIKAEKIPHETSDVAGHVTVSAGITTGMALSEADAEEYMKKADTALYESKQNGRDRYTFLEVE